MYKCVLLICISWCKDKTSSCLACLIRFLSVCHFRTRFPRSLHALESVLTKIKSFTSDLDVEKWGDAVSRRRRQSRGPATLA